MSKTLLALQTGVRRYLDESNQADFLDSEVTAAINHAYHDTVVAVMEVYQDYYNSTTQFQYSTVANQQEYTIDSSIIQIRRAECNYTPNITGSTALRLISLKLDELPLNVANTSTAGTGVGSAGYYLYGNQVGQKIGLVPLPTVTATNNITIWGIVAPADLAASGDLLNIPYPDAFGYLVELKAAAILLRKGQQEEMPAAQYMKEFEVGITKMKNFLMDRQSEGVNMIQDVEFEDIQFDNSL